MLLLDIKTLEANRARLSPDDAALRKLRDEAEAALLTGPFSVVDKAVLAPSGDAHNYMSVGPYWWPDESTPDGLPYIRRDGEVNPETTQWDRPALSAMASGASTLALAYFFTSNEEYSAHAAKLLRVWFLDEATRMNPHLQFGQAIPGRCDGRGIGIIETMALCPLPDAVAMLEASPHWNERDTDALRAWFRAYLNWLLESDYGQDEAREHNNHGTWYDAQVATFARFVNDDETATRVLSQVPQRRIAAQIEPDGRQPHELARTKSWSYSVMNLQAFFHLAKLAEYSGLDLWNYRTEDGRGLRAALNFLAPYADEETAWPHPEIGGIARTKLLPLLLQANSRYNNEYDRFIAQLATDEVIAARDERKERSRRRSGASPC